MKKYTVLLFLLILIVALTGISCKSTPPVSETEEDVDALSKSALDTLDKITQLKFPVDEARKRAIDFESPAYFPSEWEALEARYNGTDSLLILTNEQILQAETTIKTLASEYDDLFMKTVPLYAQAREDEIMSAREELADSGLISCYPEYLKNADSIALEAQDKYEAEDYYGARDTAALAMNEYELLLVGAEAFAARKEIVNRNFAAYDSENFNKAEEIAEKAINDYEGGNKEAASTNAEEAKLRYNLVLKNSWTKYSSERRKSASSERDNALSMKVNVASREAFRNAEASYNQAEENFKANKLDEAAVLFTESEARFALAIKETEEKRRLAMEKIKLAEEKIEESGDTAIEAEKIIEGGSR